MEPRSWEDIESHYLDLNNHGWKHDKILELVKFIKDTELSKRLNATTSLDKLIISNNHQIDFDKDCLQIEFERNKQKWIFKYFGGQTYNQKQPEFERTYEANEGIEKLNKFLKMIRW
jgi:hypothetical protein